MSGSHDEQLAGNPPDEVGAPEPAAEAPLSVSVTPTDGDTFTLTVKRGAGDAEVLETFPGLTMETVVEATKDSKHVVITTDVAEKLKRSLNGTKLLGAMAEREASIRGGFKELVDVVKADPGGDYPKGSPERAAHVAAEAARAKLQVFGSVSNPQVGMRLATMNRAQRMKWRASLKEEKRKKAANRIKNERRKAKDKRR